VTETAIEAVACWLTERRSMSLSPATVTTSKSAILDLLGAAAGGREVLAAEAIRGYAKSSFGGGGASVWFGADRLHPAGATLANSAAGAALDVDDGHRRASGHPGSGVIPAVLATAEVESSTGTEVLTAITVGYEVAVRAGAALRLARTDTIATGHWCAAGVAAAVGYLVGLSERELGSAIGTALAFSPRLAVLGSDAHDIKEGIPWAAHAGVAAAQLARIGFNGPRTGFDDGQFDRAVLLRGLGVEPPLIDTVYFKPYACCRWAHAAIDAALSLVTAHEINAAAIEDVQVDTFDRATTLFNDANPSSLEAAQYSVPFCVATAITRGGEALLPLESSTLGSPEILSLAERVRLRVDPDLDAGFPSRVPARVTIRTTEGAFTCLVEEPLGEPTNPLGWDELVLKFDRLSATTLEPATRHRVVQTVADLETAATIHPLVALLRPEDSEQETTSR
jgi:2-methylcitrate dehydratase PrpD